MSNEDMELDKVLQRQLKKLKMDYSSADPSITALLETVNNTYKLHRKEMTLLNRAMILSSDELMEKNKKLSEAAELNQQFSYIVAHDLKQPLRTISSFIKLLQKKLIGNNDNSVDEYIQFIDDGSKRITKYLEDLMNYLVLDQEKVVPNEKLDIEELVKEICKNSFGTIAKEMVFGNLHNLSACESHFHHLFVNLISNSLKFKKQNTTPVIQIWSESKNDLLWLYYQDNGIGIAPKYQDQVFKIFTRLDHQFDGTGIGLSICKKIIESNQGNIKIDNGFTDGLKIDISLPLELIWGENQ